jgi:hypothetical protein
MLTVPHMVAGGALGSLVGEVPGQNLFAFAVGWGSHYVLDALPHWERLFGQRGSGFSTQTPINQWPKSFLYQAISDGIIAVVLMALVLLWRGELSAFWQSPVFWGALGGFFPDLIDNTPIINRLTGKLEFVQIERKFHHDNHISVESQEKMPGYTGLVSQLIIVGAGLWLLF